MNRLAQEPSPYLRQHAENPVDWYAWGDEALERARREDKPILLSVGYSACHWCHVMAHESFEDASTARVMNELFVNVKVDREERPDLDQLYQGVVQLMGRGGGWPLTVFLTPDLRPFYGGTYFPRSARYGLPGFVDLIGKLAEAWRGDREKVLVQAREFENGLAYVARFGLEAKPGELRVEDVVAAASALEAEVDRVHGGFGRAPKFPNPMNLALLLRGFRRSGRPELETAVTLTLERMATSGTYDQLGGGFHRYSVDERWAVPHFEKMLYDNALLLHLYAEAHQLRPADLWRKVARETVEWLEREMTSPDGGFYAAQDADSEGEEGKFFVWTPAEIDAALPKELAELARRWFGVTPGGNFEHGRTVLHTRESAEGLARALGRDGEGFARDVAEARRRLFEARWRRVHPGLDDKVLAGWNGLMIRGLALASRAFAEPSWALLAARAADLVLARMWDGRVLRRSWQKGEARIDGFIEDYGDVASGLVALFQATFEPRYLEAADAIARRAVELFWDEGERAYLSAPKGQKDLFVPTFALHDNAYPSGASTLTEAQVALAALTGETSHLDQAGRYVARMREPMTQNPFGYGHLLLAADALLDGAAEVTIVGARAALRPFVEVMNRTYAPTTALLAHDPSSPAPAIAAAVLADRAAPRGAARAYVCRRFTCEAPLADPAELAAQLTPKRA